jgi:DNA-binding CsgD family transcriptional regulator/tetratricopeptide (TPR) repeat protein
MVVLEDLHAADEASLAVVAHVSRAAPDDGHLVAGAYRSDAPMRSAILARFLEALDRDRMVAADITLRSLTPEEAQEMLGAVLGRTPKESERSLVATLGEGIPFFIEEIADMADAGGVPRSIGLSASSRLHGLTSDAATVARVASLMIGPVDPAILAHACAMSTEEVGRHLVDAVAVGLLADREGKLVFRHALVRDAVAASVVSVEAKRIHGRLASALEEQHAGETEIHSMSLARHYQEAGDGERAMAFFLKAGERALAFAATEEARTAFASAFELSSKQSIQALRGLAEVEFREGNEKEAAALFRQVADQLLVAGDRVEAVRSLGRLAWTMRGRTEPAHEIELLDRAVARLEGTKADDVLAQLLILKAWVFSYTGGHTEAEELLTRALALVRPTKDDALYAEVYDGLSEVAENRGAMEECLVLAERAATAAMRSGNAELIGRTHNNWAVKLAAWGDPVAALSILEDTCDVLAKSHGRAAVQSLRVTQAWVSWLQGRPDDAVRYAAGGGHAWHRWGGYRTLVEAWAALEHGENDHARSLVKRRWEDIGGEERRDGVLEGRWEPSSDEAFTLLCETLVSVALDPSPETLAKAALLARYGPGEASEELEMGHCLVLLARAQLQMNKIADAQTTSERLARFVGQFPYSHSKATSIEIAALVSQAAGDRTTAEQSFRHASEHFASCANLSDQARCLRSVAELLLASSPEDRAEAEQLLTQARDLAAEAGASVEMNRAEAVLRGMGIRPRAGRPSRSEEARPGGLSPREMEIVQLVAAGEANAAIAARLFLSKRTVQDHISNAITKLELPSRAALASWAAKQGMV